MLLFLSLTGVVLSVILLRYNARTFTSALYLGVFFLLISFLGITKYALVYSHSARLISIFFIHFGSLNFLIGPMLYWYVRSVLTDNTRLKKNDLWHLMPFLFVLIADIPYIVSSYSSKYQVASLLAENIANLWHLKPTIMYEIVPVGVIFMILPVTLLGYSLWSAGLFVHYLVRRRKFLVLSRQQYMAKWLSVLLGSLILMFFSQVFLLGEIFSHHDSTFLFTMNTLQILSFTGLLILEISPFFFPAILYGLPRFPESTMTLNSGTGEIDLLPDESRKEKHSYETAYLLHIKVRIDTCMRELEPYLHPDCNLPYLSKLTGIPVHHLAYYFREEKKQSFNDFRNQWRVNHSKRLILEGKAKELTLEAIGLLSGFATRNTFFTSFKKFEGVSPGIFVAQLTENPDVPQKDQTRETTS